MRQRTWKPGKWLALALALIAASSLTAQDFQIRTRVDLVVVPVTVKDDDRLVTGLSQNDFVVYEDGQKQSITNFSTDPVPISAVLLIDNDLSSESFSKVLASIPVLAGSFAEVDEVAVYRFGKFIDKLSDFSSDELVVETALKKLSAIGPSAMTTMSSGPFSTAGPTINGTPIIPSTQVPGAVPAPPTRLLNDAIFTATNDLASRPADRRKIIVVISDGQNRRNDHSYEDTRDRLLDRGIQVYAVGMDQSILSRSFSVLDSYADDTGGDACFLNGQLALESCYTRSIEEARYQYVLGYTSNQKVSGPIPVYRKIEVALPGTDYDKRHRKGYFQAP